MISLDLQYSKPDSNEKRPSRRRAINFHGLSCTETYWPPLERESAFDYADKPRHDMDGSEVGKKPGSQGRNHIRLLQKTSQLFGS